MDVQEAITAAMVTPEMKAALEALEAASEGQATVEVKVAMTGVLNGRETAFAVTFRVGDEDEADRSGTLLSDAKAEIELRPACSATSRETARN